ncbi:MAG: acetyltransferase [Phycisphaerae bacterium]
MSILVYCAGGHARVLLELLERAGMGPVAGFVDDNPDLQGKKVGGFQVMGPTSRALTYAKTYHLHRAIVAITDNRKRREFTESAHQANLRLPILIHPTAIVSPEAKIGDASVVMAGAVVGPGVHTGMGAIINTGAIVDHDCQLGDYVHIAPGAILTGGVCVSDDVFIGAGAILVQQVCIGVGAIVGAGATVIRDVPSYATVVGTPARIIKQGQPVEIQVATQT